MYGRLVALAAERFRASEARKDVGDTIRGPTGGQKLRHKSWPLVHAKPIEGL